MKLKGKCAQAYMASIIMLIILGMIGFSEASAATRYVTNCNDSGSGSLRAAIASAGSTDIIDMQTLSCTVNLSSSLIINQSELTIRGKDETSFGIPVTGVSGLGQRRPFRHMGAGTLRLENFRVTSGQVMANEAEGWGGCILSYGNVSLYKSFIGDCNATSNHNRTEGGAIHAKGNITATESVFSASAATASGNSSARGGALYSGGEIELIGSVVAHNEAAVEGQGTGDAYGGGVYAVDRITLKQASAVYQNIARADATNRYSYGGGTYSEDDVRLFGASLVYENTAEAHNARGGGIFAEEHVLMMEEGAVYGNKTVASNHYGSGVHAASASMMEGSAVHDNKVVASNPAFSATGVGGGLYVSVDLYINESSVYNNDGVVGGGFYAASLIMDLSSVYGNNATSNSGGFAARRVDVWKSTISGNTAGTHAGARLDGEGTGPQPSVKILSSTISGNESTGDTARSAGLNTSAENILIENSTITDNFISNPLADNQAGYHGAGLYLHSPHGNDISLELVSSVVHGNYRPTGGGGKVLSDIAFPSSQSLTITGYANSARTTIIGHTGVLPPDTITDFESWWLGPLQDNGGPTLTHMPAAGSELIDAGDAGSYTHDQRGIGFPRVVGAAADIGAVEFGEREDRIFSDRFEK